MWIARLGAAIGCACALVAASSRTVEAAAKTPLRPTDINWGGYHFTGQHSLKSWLAARSELRVHRSQSLEALTLLALAVAVAPAALMRHVFRDAATTVRTVGFGVASAVAFGLAVAYML